MMAPDRFREKDGAPVSRTILVVDDEPPIVTLLDYELTRRGYRVVAARDGASALELVRREHPDLIILDLMLPAVSGLDVLREVKAQEEIPVIMLTARKDEVDRVVGLELGADDYVTKPFSLRELMARVQALLRRHAALSAHAELMRHGLTVQREQRRAVLNGRPLDLTAKEFDILLCLIEQPGRVLTRRELFQRVWGLDAIDDTRTVTVHIRNLRDKLKEAASLIETVRGVGYRFRAD